MAVIGSRYNKGDLCGVSSIDETIYGQTPVGAFSHMGVMKSLKIDDGIQTEEESECGSRAMGKQYLIGRDVVANVRCRVGTDVGVCNWLMMFLGGNDDSAYPGITSQTFLFKIANRSVDALRGACINSLKISSSGMGKPLDVDAEIFAREHVIECNHTPATISTQIPERCTGFWTCSNATVGRLPSAEWTLSLTQNFEKVPDIVGGIASESGQPPVPGTPEFTLEISGLKAKDRALDRLRHAFTTELTLTFLIEDYTLTLSGCTLDGDGPSRTDATYDDTFKVTARHVGLTERS